MERKRIRLLLLLMLDNLPTMQTTSGEEYAEKEAEKVIYLVNTWRFSSEKKGKEGSEV